MEIQQGETLLAEKKGKLLRKVQVASINVYYKDGDRKYKLIEDHQEFADGRTRKRSMEGSVSEKMKPGENPKVAATRGIREELGIQGDIKIKGAGKSEKEITSPSYPGLSSKYVTHKFETILTPDQYSAEGYIEDDGKKKTFFVWKQIH